MRVGSCLLSWGNPETTNPVPRTPRLSHKWSEGSLGRAAGERTYRLAGLPDFCLSSLRDRDIKKTQPPSLELEKHWSGLFSSVLEIRTFQGSQCAF